MDTDRSRDDDAFSIDPSPVPGQGWTQVRCPHVPEDSPMKRCLLLIAMAITVSSMSGCIVDTHRPHPYYGDAHHQCDQTRDRDCHDWHH